MFVCSGCNPVLEMLEMLEIPADPKNTPNTYAYEADLLAKSLRRDLS